MGLATDRQNRWTTAQVTVTVRFVIAGMDVTEAITPDTPAAASPKPLEVMLDKSTGLTFVFIPPGEFLMGSTNKKGKNERPVHPVRITQAFSLGKYPVTNAQYSRFLETSGEGSRKPTFWNARQLNQPEQPVVGVDWDEAVAFAKWCGGRLPTEAEWEYACRAGTTTDYSFGDDEKQMFEYGWWYDNSQGQSRRVGKKQANPWGLHDMHGNVWEWCQDWYGDYPPTGGQDDPQGPVSGLQRVRRGGSWNNSARNCRSASRRSHEPSFRGHNMGFRVAFNSSFPKSRPDSAKSPDFHGT